MLVITRKNDESIRFPGTGIEVRILRPGPSRVRIGVKAPPEIPILRGELSDEQNRFQKEPPLRSTLIVEDNRNESQLLACYLKLKRMSVQTAENGADAMAYLEDHAIPDIILLDLNMPKFDGVWTVSRLRANPSTRHIPIIAVSGESPEEVGLEIGPHGVDAWYPKPIDPEQLFRELNSEFMALVAS
ncbi:MAG: response regulator [Planctomycetota bacterium]